MNTLLAEVAREEARKNYHGETDTTMNNLQALAELFDAVDGVTLDTLSDDWSGAFAYLCTELAGVGLPLKYPDPRVRASFASVAAWEDYARLPKIRLWHGAEEVPEVGDLVIFENPEDVPPRMGVVLSVTETDMDVALGNHRKHSAVIEHPLRQGIRGYIRLIG